MQDKPACYVRFLFFFHQDTLAEATALLTEFEETTQDMEVGSTSTGSAMDSGYGTNGGSTDKITPGDGDTETEPGDSQDSTQKYFIGDEEEEADDQL